MYRVGTKVGTEADGSRLTPTGTRRESRAFSLELREENGCQLTSLETAPLLPGEQSDRLSVRNSLARYRTSL